MRDKFKKLARSLNEMFSRDMVAACAFVCGIWFVVLLDYLSGYTSIYFRNFTPVPLPKAAQHWDGFHAPVPNMDVILRFEPIEDIHKENKGLPNGNNVLAWTEVGAKPCIIHFPSGFWVYASLKDPNNAKGNSEGFENDYLQKAFAHELLHCISGYWHG